ncbi:MAG: TRAP transporter small permease [Sporomusaceae bacterium]|nr:TRAP transporter small permease [Sporomusaceae bacterium]
MGNISKAIQALLYGVIAIFLSMMALFVFGNVVLRYFFNSGLTWAEEASRYLFIWLIFLGAIVAFKENAHLGVDTLVNRLSVKNRKRLYIFNNLLILATMLLVIHGSFNLTLVSLEQRSPSLNISLAYVYVSSLLAGLSIGGIAVFNIYRLLARRLDAADLVMTTDSEEKEQVDKAANGPAKGA